MKISIRLLNSDDCVLDEKTFLAREESVSDAIKKALYDLIDPSVLEVGDRIRIIEAE